MGARVQKYFSVKDLVTSIDMSFYLSNVICGKPGLGFSC